MRRKSERAATKKAKTSPEKKVEKVKQTRTRRKKQSTSSENESVEEPTSVPDTVIVVQIEENPPLTPAKEMTAEEAQVWRVKASEGSGDAREIQKLKICLTRPPSTPERVDRSPRSKRKHSRATSSSDTPIVEITEDRKKSKHRSKRLLRESKDGSEKNQDSYGEEQDNETTQSKDNDAEVTQSDTVEEIVIVEAPMSTTSEEVNQTTQIEPIETQLKPNQVPSEMVESDSDRMDKTDADTTVVSPNVEPTVVLPTNETPIEVSTSEITIPVSASETAVAKCSNETTTSVPTSETTVSVSPSETIISVSETETIIASEIENQENKSEISTFSKQYSPERKRSVSVDKSEILELHAEESKCESDSEMGKPKEDMKEELTTQEEMESQNAEVSISRDKSVDKEAETTSNERNNAINETDVVVSSESEKELRNMSIGSGKDQDVCSLNLNSKESEDKNLKERHQNREIECSDSMQSNQEEPLHNGQSAPIVVSRKRRWGSRPKLTSQKSITISTDVLKDIIPDVKPVEFNEVIEDKKHKREVVEKIERPVLPKIIIDNTDNIERRKENVDKDKENVKVRESHLAMNRKISIVKENESIIARPPSPPRHKQSCILFITNLVRPFTEQQLKNLLQRTGRFVDNGFWIDKIKSKCFVIYQTEEQAVETRHALHGVTWPVSNPKTLQVDFSTQEAFDKAKLNEDADNAQVSTMPDTMDDWIREQDLKRERGEQQEKPWERKAATREWDLGKNDKEKEKLRRDDRPLMEKRRHRTPERSPEPARKFKKKEEEAPAKLLDDLFRKTKTTPCIYWLPLSADMIAIKEEQRRQHMADHERRLQEQRRTHRRH